MGDGVVGAVFGGSVVVCDGAYDGFEKAEGRGMKLKSYVFYGGVVALTSWVLGFCLFCLYAFSLKYTTVPNVDAIVVLTGGADRISRAVDLLREGKADALFISGVNSKVSLGALFSETDDALVPKIHLGYLADNTYENAMETDMWIQKNDVRSVLLVTSFYHMPRSLFEIETRIPRLVVYPYPVFPKKMDTQLVHTRHFWLLFVEYNKFLVVVLRSFLRSLFI